MSTAVDKIISRINEDVEIKIKKIQKDTREKIEKIRNEEYAKWEREKKKLELEGKREVESIKRLIISKAQLEGRRELLAAREELMENIIERIKLNAKNAPRYSEYIRSSIEDAKNVLGEEFTIVCIPEDKDMVEKFVSEIAPKAKVVMGAVKHGGIMVKSADGERGVDYSIDALVERKINEIRKKIVSKLFEGEHA